jgi:DNA-binding transcriptional MocR family regulator
MESPKNTIDLRKGSPAPELLPVDILTSAFNTIMRDQTTSTRCLDYGPGAGNDPVRKTIADWLCRRYSIPDPNSERVAVTAGASQNISCILQCYTSLECTQAIYLVAPTYHLVCDIFEDHEFTGRLQAIPEDDQGVDIALLESKMRADCERTTSVCLCTLQFDGDADWFHQVSKVARPHRKCYSSIIYCVPTFSNPTGMTMTITRREQLVRLARRYNALIISDDVYDFLKWGQAPPLPRLVDIDAVLDGGPPTPFGNTVSNGSFSKLLGPGLRTGWAEGTAAFIHGLFLCGSSTSGGPPSQLSSWLAAEAIASGQLDKHIDEVLRPALQRRSQMLLGAIKIFLVPLGMKVGGALEEVTAGYFISVKLPAHINSKSLCERAEREQSLLLACGKLFAVHGDESVTTGEDFVRLCFAYEDENRLVDGIKRMAVIIEGLNLAASQAPFGNVIPACLDSNVKQPV